MPDTLDEARARLVGDLVRDGRVRSEPVRDAFAAVPRHLFLPGLEPEDAYADEAVPIKVDDDGVTLSSVSQPSMVAIMLEQLAAGPGHRVLEIGAGAGWNAGLIAHIVGPDGAVTTVDIDDDLVRQTRSNLDAAGIPDVDAVTADGSRGHPAGAPYDRIELTVGTADVRPEWVDQLVPGGRLVLPLGVRGSQLSIAFVRAAPGLLESVSVRSCAFVRLRGAGAEPSGPLCLAAPGWTAQVSECGVPTAGLLDAALARPGIDRDSPEPASESDVWDGLGLWCALADPAVFRLMACGPAAGTTLGRSLPPSTAGRAAVGIAVDDGIALLLGDPAHVIRAFGDGGDAAANRLTALVEDWVAAGRPHAADLRITADVSGSPDDTADGTVSPAAVSSGDQAGRAPSLDVVVTTVHGRLRVRMP